MSAARPSSSSSSSSCCCCCCSESIKAYTPPAEATEGDGAPPAVQSAETAASDSQERAAARPPETSSSITRGRPSPEKNTCVPWPGEGLLCSSTVSRRWRRVMRDGVTGAVSSSAALPARDSSLDSSHPPSRPPRLPALALWIATSAPSCESASFASVEATVRTRRDASPASESSESLRTRVLFRTSSYCAARELRGRTGESAEDSDAVRASASRSLRETERSARRASISPRGGFWYQSSSWLCSATNWSNERGSGGSTAARNALTAAGAPSLPAVHPSSTQCCRTRERARGSQPGSGWRE
mmetsp:Transcript_8139/g.19545  ORF Transcript_8139/g.19545 Transcript_8139/m.19545 type:complete len:301 (+) Transcript_8139:683-1585(+)